MLNIKVIIIMFWISVLKGYLFVYLCVIFIRLIVFRNVHFFTEVFCFFAFLYIVKEIFSRNNYTAKGKRLQFSLNRFSNIQDMFHEKNVLIVFFAWMVFITLTFSFPMHPFSSPWKHQQTVRFFDVLRGGRKDALGTNGLKRG